MKNKVMLGFTSLAAIALSLNSVVPVLADTGTTNPETPAQTVPSNDQNKSTNQTDTSTPSTGNASTGSQTINNADLNKGLSLNGKYAKLTKDSVVFDKNGKLLKTKKLKKGTIIGVSGINTVQGKVLIGYNGNKNKYISVKDVKLFKVVQYTVKRNAFVYNNNGRRISRYYIKKGKRVFVIRTRKINGVNFVIVNGNYLIKWSSLDHKSAKVISS